MGISTHFGCYNSSAKIRCKTGAWTSQCEFKFTW